VPDNHGEAIKILTSDDPARRVAIVRRPDGYYAIRPERWEEEVNWHEGSFTGGWLPIGGSREFLKALVWPRNRHLLTIVGWLNAGVLTRIFR
jgi:hypothetical protein